MLGFIFAYSVVQITTDTFPGAIDTALGGGWKYTWAALLIIGSSTALIGIYMKNDSRGLVFEQTGMVWTGGASVIYTFALLDYNRAAAWFAATLFFSFGVSCLLRFRDIRRDLKAVAEGRLTMTTPEDPGGNP
jgi:hypothetical protein